MLEKIFSKNKGFTLMEILVAIGIFALLSSIFTVIYVTLSKDQQRAKASQALLNNSLYVLELLARDIKNNELDYNFLSTDQACNSTFHPQDCIVFKRLDGSLGSFLKPNGDGSLWYSVLQCDNYPSQCSFLQSEGTELLSASLNDIQVDYLRFLVQPVNESYLDQSINQQPKVTIILKTSYVSQKAVEQISYTLQTTVSSRIYKR